MIKSKANRIRAFLGFPVQQTVIDKIHDAILNQYEYLGAQTHLVKPSNYHITLYFLGNIAATIVPMIVMALNKALADSELNSLCISKIGPFPAAGSRIIAAHVKINQELENLYHRVVQTMLDVGVPVTDARRYKPHITVCRLKQATKKLPYINFETELEAPKKLILYESRPGKHGSDYVPLQIFNLPYVANYKTSQKLRPEDC